MQLVEAILSAASFDNIVHQFNTAVQFLLHDIGTSRSVGLTRAQRNAPNKLHFGYW